MKPKAYAFLLLVYEPFQQQTGSGKGDSAMGKIIECAKVDPSSGCTHVVRGNTEEEVLKNAMEHAKQHGIREVTPELKAKVKAAIRDEK
jgi:predicted small metal-binding protein